MIELTLIHLIQLKIDDQQLTLTVDEAKEILVECSGFVRARGKYYEPFKFNIKGIILNLEQMKTLIKSLRKVHLLKDLNERTSNELGNNLLIINPN